MKRWTHARFLAACGLAIAGLGMLASQSGCVPLMANLAHVVGADLAPPEYPGLKKAKVAVVTLSDQSQFSEDLTARMLSRKVSEILETKVNDIELVREEQVEDWRDRHGWDQLDFVEIGRGVEAEKVVGIQLANLRLREGPNLYRGHADVTIEVFDTATGKRLFKKDLDDFTFPKNAAQDMASITEAKFESLYLRMLSQQIARAFHPYDVREDFALDGKIANF